MDKPTLTCYMCSSLKTSVEHVPPKGLFPKQSDLPHGVDLRKQLITVPSCNLHNSEKSKDDEYLMYALVFGIQNNQTAVTQVKTKISRALVKRVGIAKLIARHQKPVKVENTTTGILYETVALRIDMQKIDQGFDHIGRALHFHHYQSKWQGEIQSIPLFLLALNGESPQDHNSHLELLGRYVEELLANQPSYGENPEVFTYKTIKVELNLPLVMLLNFYEGSKVVLLFRC